MLIRSGMGMQLSGSVGGVTAARNRYGAYLRNRTVPVNPGTARQLAARAAFSGATLRWATLTDAQRQGWQAYATGTPLVNKLGETITLSASAMYVRTNAFRLQTIGGLVDDAPLTPGVASIGTDLVFAHAAGVLSLARVGGIAAGFVLVGYGPPVSSGVSSFQGPFSQYASSVPASFAAIAQDAFRYGVPVIGELRFFRVRGSAPDGKLTDVFIQKVEIVA